MLIVAITSCSNFKLRVPESPAESPEQNFKVKALVETSGSMDGYMCSGAEFKDAIYSYLTAVSGMPQCQSVGLFYVNDKVTPMGVGVQGLIGALNPASFAQAGGSIAHSDFKQILTDVIGMADENTVVAFASDFILDIPKGEAAGYLNITETDIENIVTAKAKKLPSLSFCIYQMDSRFNGTYFYPRGGHCQYAGTRPWYLWVIGSQKNLARIRRAVPDSRIQHGVKNYCAFAPETEIAAGLFENGTFKKEIALRPKGSQALTCQIALDLSQTLLADSYLSSPFSWQTSDGGVRVSSVTKMQNQNGQFTHLATLQLPEGPFSSLLKVKPQGLPDWVEKLDGKRDDALEPGKTFSLRYTIGGVANAFSKYQNAAKTSLIASK